MQAFLDIFDIYLLEAVLNGILLGGVLALLALGLNLIFGVIDVTWICYAELVMIGMYGMYFLVQYYGVWYFIAAPLTILLVAALGALLHYLVIAPVKRVSAMADAVSLGNEEVETYIKPGKDEISSLSVSFNRMRQSLDHAMQMLKG